MPNGSGTNLNRFPPIGQTWDTLSINKINRVPRNTKKKKKNLSSSVKVKFTEIDSSKK